MTDDESDRLRRALHTYAPSRGPHPHLAARARSQAHGMRRRRRAGYGAAAVVVAAAVAAIPLTRGLGAATDDTPRPAATTPSPIANCPVTQAVPRGQVPKTLRDLTGDWVGAGDLWVQPPTGAVSPGSTRLKYYTFTLDEKGRMSDADGPPSLSARRLDGPGTATGDPQQPDSYASATGPHNSVIHFWPTTITLPSPGCWELTATLQSTRVRFVVHVDPARSASPHGSS